jgi:hypothetical protein
MVAMSDPLGYLTDICCSQGGGICEVPVVCKPATIEREGKTASVAFEPYTVKRGSRLVISRITARASVSSRPPASTVRVPRCSTATA